MRISGWSSDVCSSDLIAIDRRGRVAVAMQYEGPADDDVPLVALHDPGAGETGFRYLPMPRAEQTALRQYCCSAANARTGHHLAVSSPRGQRETRVRVVTYSVCQSVYDYGVAG